MGILISKPSPDELARAWSGLEDCGSFSSFIGPIYRIRSAPSADELFRIGFEVQPHHCNPSGACHGGMLASVLDIALGRGAVVMLNRPGPTPTITMTMDFLAPAFPGDWIESRTQLVHNTFRTGFMQCVLFGPSGPVVRGNGVFKMSAPIGQVPPAS